MATEEQRAEWARKAAALDAAYADKLTAHRQQVYVLAHEMFPDVVFSSELSNGQYEVVMAEYTRRQNMKD